MAKFCFNCGNKVEENSYICTKCGVVVNNNVSNKVVNINDNGGIAWAILGFFVPLAGLILYLIWRNERPKTAASVGKGALISTIVGVIIYVLFMILLGIIFIIMSSEF